MATVQPHNLPVAAATFASDIGDLPMATAEISHDAPSSGATPAVCVTDPAAAPGFVQKPPLQTETIGTSFNLRMVI